MVSTVRKGYASLAMKMQDAALLDDADQVYFLTHDEIGQLLKDHNPAWKIKANKRREILPELDNLVFEEVSFGIPEPLEHEVEIEITIPLMMQNNSAKERSWWPRLPMSAGLPISASSPV